MANTRSAIKRIRQNVRRVAVNAPRRTAAKTYAAKALRVASGDGSGDPAAALAEAMAALDRAAKSGAIHRNAAARRKSRLALKVNAAVGGVVVAAVGKARATGKAAAAKAARARVAASRARAEAGPKTAAGKARVALAKTATSGAKATSTSEAPKPAAAKAPVKKPASRATASSKNVPATAKAATSRTRKSSGGKSA